MPGVLKQSTGPTSFAFQLEDGRLLRRHQGYLPFTWENRKFQLENQMVRAIPLGKLKKTWAVI